MSKNILEPKTINIDGDNITLYTARFNGLYDLYDYLKSNPKINTKAFNEDYLSSIYFDGNISYEEALENLKKYINLIQNNEKNSEGTLYE